MSHKEKIDSKMVTLSTCANPRGGLSLRDFLNARRVLPGDTQQNEAATDAKKRRKERHGGPIQKGRQADPFRFVRLSPETLLIPSDQRLPIGVSASRPTPTIMLGMSEPGRRTRRTEKSMILHGVTTATPIAAGEVLRERVARSNYREPRLAQKTVLFGDIVGSTELLSEIGDRQWMKLLNKYYRAVRKGLAAYQGHHLSIHGDGFLAIFEHPFQAIQCAVAIRESVIRFGLRMRIGMHLGECLSVGKFVGGLTVHIGARIAARANAGEVLVSDAVKTHLSETDVRFIDRGSHDLKGVPGKWRLFAAC